MESHWLGDDGRNVCGVMEIASETGSATEMLDEIADDYEEELDTIANQIEGFRASDHSNFGGASWVPFLCNLFAYI